MTKINVGGQAVIEGVMMRAPNALAIAVRKANGEVAVKEDAWRSLSGRLKFLRWPVIRGSVVFLEALINGLQALSYSAHQALEEEKGKKTETLSSFALALVMAAAFGIGLLFFVVLPHFLTAFLGRVFGRELNVDSVLFHLIDGAIKVFFFVSYVYAISFMKDIRRIFQYHGAEHKCIFAYENGDDLTVANCQKYSTLHPRCGTAFLLLVILISIFLFSLAFPFFPRFPELGKTLENLVYVGLKMPLLFPVAGLAYEGIKISGKNPEHFLFRWLVAPGLWLQRLTTRQPSDDQVEIALRALQGALRLENGRKIVL